MRSLLILAVIAAVFAWRGGLLAGPIDDSMLRSTGPDECATTERCLVVYLAPWCPQCRKSGGLVKELRARAALSSSVGFKVVVGKDEREALDRYAHKLGGFVHYDDDGSFYREIGASGVPAWVAWDAERRVVGKLYGRPLGAPNHVLADHMIQELGLAGVL